MQNLLVIILAVFAFLVLIAAYIYVIIPFMSARRFIRMEMGRAFDEREYQHWEKELRRLYLRHIPIIGWFFR